MITVVPQWPYLVQNEGAIRLEMPGLCNRNNDLGEYCGEWGSYVPKDAKPAGVRIMLFFDYVGSDCSLLRSVNFKEADGDLVVLLTDERLPDADGCPFLPVYRGRRSDGQEILQLSGF